MNATKYAKTHSRTIISTVDWRVHPSVLRIWTRTWRFVKVSSLIGNERTTFDEAWGILNRSFEMLQKFCGMLSSVCPTIIQTVRDFTIVKVEQSFFSGISHWALPWSNFIFRTHGDIQTSLDICSDTLPRPTILIHMKPWMDCLEPKIGYIHTL